MSKIDFVTVVNNVDMYETYYINNKNVNKHNLVMYDNNVENISITQRYNDYIKNKMPEDTWVVFCHQDFEIHEDIETKLKNLDKNSIYGPIGAGLIRQFVFFLRIYKYKLMKGRI